MGYYPDLYNYLFGNNGFTECYRFDDQFSMRQALFVVVLVLVVQFRTSAEDPFAMALQERMPALLATNHVPGAVVSYITDGGVAWTKAFGLANVRTDAPMQPEMVFNHGSDGKVLTAWGMMRLAEEGKVELDAPANRYLKRWQIRSTKFDSNGVTIRRLLSHTAGLTVHGFSDYEQGARLPTLVEMLEGKNQNDGSVFIKWQPGARNVYSGGGFVVLQMIIEDVSGEPFAAFMEQEVAAPLGLRSLKWVWTPQLERRAPTPYDEQQKAVGYRQLACQAIGSEICTVADFARFVAAAVPGPHGEPMGRGVLKPETVSAMLQPQPNAESCGLGYGISSFKGDKVLAHAGANPGWSALFVLDVKRREGLVIANNSSLGLSLNDSVIKIWAGTSLSRVNGNEHH
ncbi:MAG: serine hydrolase domain-containing protein [Limisphaerales bacterium]